MKRRLQIIAAVLFGLTVSAQETPVLPGTVTTGTGYANNVYYKLSTQASVTFDKNAWDLAFYRVSSMDKGIRVNDGKGILVYEASSSMSDWATINVNNIEQWTKLYNDETNWTIGAFDRGSASPYGWGAYNPATHHVVGNRIFVLQYATGVYKKIKIDDYFGAYTFTYSTWDGTAWSADTTYTLANSNNPTTRFNYYSLETNAAVVAEPAITDWDLLFTKYFTNLGTVEAPVMYNVTGVLHNAGLTVAENVGTDTAGLTYSASINTIGSDWKTFTGTAYNVSTDKNYYVKYANGTIYKVNFNTFEGSGTGVTTFNQQDVTAALGTDTFENNVSFGIYPNPSTDKKINVVYELPSGNSDENVVTIYSLTGAKVYESKINNTGGFFNKEINLQNLNSGIYLLKFESGSYSTTKKLILK